MFADVIYFVIYLFIYFLCSLNMLSMSTRRIILFNHYIEWNLSYKIRFFIIVINISIISTIFIDDIWLYMFAYQQNSAAIN